MQLLKRVLWLFVAGLVTAAGASLAIAFAIFAFQDYASARKHAEYKPDPLNYQPPEPGAVVVSDLVIIEVTHNGGVRGMITNNTPRKLNSFNAHLDFMRGDDLLYRCRETVMVDVEPNKSARFQLLCLDVARSALTPEVKPKLSLLWVYPSRDE
jgi:hypothetical protein